jgi:hypothetical protein
VKLFPKGLGDDAKKQAYRIKERYGWVAPSCKLDQRYPPHPDSPMPKQYQEEFQKLNDGIVTEVAKLANPALRIVVINDDSHIFRHLKAIDQVVKQFTQRTSDFLVLAMASPLAKGGIWKVIEEEIKRDANLAKRIAVIIPAAALRSEGLNIPENRAIETAAYDLARHAQSDTVFKQLMKCQHVIVRDFDGVFHFNKNETKRFDYYFRPFEGGPEFNPSLYGTMSGYEKILITSIVKEMLASIVKKTPCSAPTVLSEGDPFSPHYATQAGGFSLTN